MSVLRLRILITEALRLAGALLGMMVHQGRKENHLNWQNRCDGIEWSDLVKLKRFGADIPGLKYISYR